MNIYNVFIKKISSNLHISRIHLIIQTLLQQKTEIVFLIVLVIAPFIKNNFIMQIIFTTLVLTIFIRGKVKFVIIFIIISFKLFFFYTTLIVDYNWTSNKGINYATTKGNIYLSNYYEPGTLILGKSYQDEYEFKTIQIPVISKLLSIRKDFSYDLNIRSNGQLKLTQA